MNTLILLWITFIIVIACPILLWDIQKKNMKYYKLVGRDPVEIESWLKTRSWYGDFVSNISKDILLQYEDPSGKYKYILNDDVINEIDEKTSHICSGKDNTLTISNAFCWPNTTEGTEYWGKREKEFLMWYFGQYVDFHLFK